MRKTETDKYSNHERVRVNNNNNNNKNNKKAQIAVLITWLSRSANKYKNTSRFSAKVADEAVCYLFSLIRNCID